MKDYSLYEMMDMPDPNFPIKVYHVTYKKLRELFKRHWHEHIELLYFIEGQAIIECNLRPIKVIPGDIIIINSNELHRGEAISDSLTYFIIILDISMLMGQTHDTSQSKYILPIASNLILFQNKISGDALINECINKIICEYNEKKSGYELAIKSAIYYLFVILLRRYINKVLTEKEHSLREKNMDRFSRIFRYVELNYMYPITTHKCAKMLNITVSHFCHLFKQLTGMTFSNYVNYLRIKKAETLLRNTNMTITEIAISIGYNDVAYFSRIFKKQKNISPSEYRNRAT